MVRVRHFIFEYARRERSASSLTFSDNHVEVDGNSHGSYHHLHGASITSIIPIRIDGFHFFLCFHMVDLLYIPYGSNGRNRSFQCRIFDIVHMEVFHLKEPPTEVVEAFMEVV